MTGHVPGSFGQRLCLWAEGILFKWKWFCMWGMGKEGSCELKTLEQLLLMTQPVERKVKRSCSAWTEYLLVLSANGQTQLLLASGPANVSGGVSVLSAVGDLSLSYPCLVAARREPALLWILHGCIATELLWILCTAVCVCEYKLIITRKSDCCERSSFFSITFL